MKCNREQLLLYAVTDRSHLGEKSLYSAVEEALEGGVTFLQLREKHLSDEEILAEARALLPLCRAHSVPLIINDSVDIALAAGADGVHVGQEDLEAGAARQKLGSGKILGVSAHNVAEALRAEKAGADYLGVGAMFPTGTKDNVVPTSPETLRAICEAVSIPVVAIGGVTGENLPRLRGCGMAGAAVVSAIFSQPDCREAARQLREILASIVK